MVPEFTHIALRVERLREAEHYYRNLFSLKVAFREAETADGWRTLPPSATWEDAEKAGVVLGLVMLYRDGFRLAIEAADAVNENGRLDHIGVYVEEEDLDRIRRRASEGNCQIVLDRPNALILVDPLGVRWELNSFPYDDPPSLSTGARTGRWVELQH
jgi:catechol 2,3-dioxygenase-like lactoylglutathione lyase family enzyme